MTADHPRPHGDSHAYSHAEGPSYLWLALLPLAAFLTLVWGLNQHPLAWTLTLDWARSSAG